MVTKKKQPTKQINTTNKQVEPIILKEEEVETTKCFIENKYNAKHFGNEHAYNIYLHIMSQVNEIFNEQPSNIGYDKTDLNNFVNAPNHGALHNVKKYITCAATDSETANSWAQHMSVILADELRKAVTRPFFKVDNNKE